VAGFTPKQERFIEEYLRDFNATQAAIRAGYKPRTAYSTGQENLKKPEIAEAIAARRARLAEEAGVTAERVVRELGRIAFFDPRRLFHPDGTPLQITELDDESAAVVAGLDVLEEYAGKGEDRHLVGVVKKWKLANKQAALETLVEHFGLAKAKQLELSGPNGGPIEVTDPRDELLRRVNRVAATLGAGTADSGDDAG
jgi:phage terminase small subunit